MARDVSRWRVNANIAYAKKLCLNEYIGNALRNKVARNPKRHSLMDEKRVFLVSVCVLKQAQYKKKYRASNIRETKLASL